MLFTLKQALTFHQNLKILEMDRLFRIITDASKFAISYIISQLICEGRDKSICYGDQKLRDIEKMMGHSWKWIASNNFYCSEKSDLFDSEQIHYIHWQ